MSNLNPKAALHERAAPSADAREPSPVTASIPDTVRLTGLSRSELYRLLAAGKLRAVKSGSRTLIVWESVQMHLASLPVATFKGEI